MRPVGPFKPPYVLADDLQAMADEIARLGRISADGADVDTGAGGLQIRIPDAGRGIWAKVTAVGTAGVSGHKPYAWTQQRPAFDGSWEDDPVGLSGTTTDDPAFEVTNKDTPTDGSAVVWLRRGYAGLDTGDVRKEWLFELGTGCLAPGGAGGTVTDHVTFVGTDCTTGQNVQTDIYLPCPARVVVTALGPADCCTTTMTYTVASTARATVNGGASAVGTDGSTISFDVVPTTDGTLSANSDTLVPSQAAVKTYVDNAVTGLLDLKGGTDCSADPNYPAALKGDAYYVTAAGKIGGASGKPVDVGDAYLATADNAGGSEASVGASWIVLEHNLTGVVLGPASTTDLALALFDGTTGKLIRDGGTRLPAYDPATGNVRVKQAAGSWSFSFGVKGSSGTDRGGFGFTGGTDALSSWWVGADQTHRGFTVTTGGEEVSNWDATGDPTKIRRRVLRSASQSVDIDQTCDEGGGPLERVNKDGYRVLKKTAAPADADLNNSEGTWSWDDVNGTPAYKGKTSAGAVKTGLTRDFTDAATGDVLHVVNGLIVGYTAGSLICQQLDYNTVMNTTTCEVTADTKYLRGVFTASDTPC